MFEGAEFPQPATEELVEALRAWEADLSDITEEQARAELGLPVKVSDIKPLDDVHARYSYFKFY